MFCFQGILELTWFQVRMGKGKGSFDHWASRIAVSKIIFEVKGNLHEKVVRDAFRLAGNKMPGHFALHVFKWPWLTYHYRPI
jgi:ribosomal protein L16/L10AE